MSICKYVESTLWMFQMQNNSMISGLKDCRQVFESNISLVTDRLANKYIFSEEIVTFDRKRICNNPVKYGIAGISGCVDK